MKTSICLKCIMQRDQERTTSDRFQDLQMWKKNHQSTVTKKRLMINVDQRYAFRRTLASQKNLRSKIATLRMSKFAHDRWIRPTFAIDKKSKSEIGHRWWHSEKNVLESFNWIMRILRWIPRIFLFNDRTIVQSFIWSSYN